MDSNSVLYQLMDIRMNGIMNEIPNRVKEYQEISRSSDEYSGRLDVLHLPKEVRLPICKVIFKMLVSYLISIYFFSEPVISRVLQTVYIFPIRNI